MKHYHVTMFMFWVFLGGFTGCQYQADPLNRQEIFEKVLEQREKIPEYIDQTKPVRFSQLAKWESENSPELKKIAAEYDVFQAVADISTPLPNPTIEGGPTFNWGISDIKRVTPYVSIGFTIPLGPRLFREDDLNAIKATEALQKVILKHRELYLQLRQNVLKLSLLQQRNQIIESMIKEESSVVSLTQQLQLQGEVSGLYSADARVALQVLQLKKVENDKELNDFYMQFAQQIGVSTNCLKKVLIQIVCPVGVKLPEQDKLNQLLLCHNGDLVQTQLMHAVAEAEYKLELANQIPDLIIGSGFSREADGLQSIGLTAGFEIPIFDRNQQAIAATQKSRKVAIMQYEIFLRNYLTSIETLLKNEKILRDQYFMLEEKSLSNKQKQLEYRRQMIINGEQNAMDILLYSRAYRELQLEVINKKIEWLATIFELEKQVGYPLFQIDDESMDLFPELNEEKKEN